MATKEIVFTEKTASTTIAVLTGIYALILTPLCIYHSYNLWKFNKQHVSFFTKRHSKIVLGNVLVFNIYVLILRTITDFTNVHNPSAWYNLGNNIKVSRLMFTQLLQIPIVVMCVRLWLLYYDYTSAMQTMDFKWKAEILKDDVRNAWTSKYRWMGNPRIVLCIACTIAIVIYLIIVSLPQYLEYTQAVPVVYVLFIVIMMIKIRKCRDQFYIRKEFIACMFTLIGLFVIYIFIFLLVPPGSYLRIVVMNVFVSIGTYALCLISTWWIILQYKLQQANAVQERVGQRLNLSDICRNQDTFDLFADHLVKEFAIENLAFILEVMQIKHEMITYKLLDADSVGFVIEIPTKILKKVRRKNAKIHTLQQLKDNMRYIMEEYIFRHAEHCINLASATRKHIMTEFGALEKVETKDNVEDLVERNLAAFTGTTEVKKEDKELSMKYACLMDSAISEISGLMQKDSLVRFVFIYSDTGTLHRMSESIRASMASLRSKSSIQ
eukprot:415497_1